MQDQQSNNVLVAFDTAQCIEFHKWRNTTELASTHYEMIDIQCGWDPDFNTGTYYCWNIWRLSDRAVQEYFYDAHTNTQPDWEQLELDLDNTLSNWREGIRFP